MKRLKLKLKMMFPRLFLRRAINKVMKAEVLAPLEANCIFCTNHANDADVPFLDGHPLKCKIGADTSNDGKNCANFNLLNLTRN
jgi:hypothetical protein